MKNFFYFFIQKIINFSRPLLRIEQGRLKPIDNYVKILLLYQDQLPYSESYEFFMKKPIKFLKQISIDQLKDLLEEANVFSFQ